jgi:hypothetical protein
MKRKFATITAAVLTAGALAGTPSATAAEDTLQAQIDEHIAQYGGVQISTYEIAWEDGEVVMSFPLRGEEHAPPSSTAAERLWAATAGEPYLRPEDDGDAQPLVGNCPTEYLGNDWYCFYENSGYGGRRLQWNADHQYPIAFGDYGFRNRVSSWVNGGGLTIRVYHGDAPGTEWYQLWTECPHTSSTIVADMDNDDADYFTETNTSC